MATSGSSRRHPPSNRLRELRIGQGLSRRDLAEQIASTTYGPRRDEPVSERTVYRWETGETKIPPERMPELAAIFGCSIEYLMGWPESNGGNGNGEQAA